jgi:superfamily II DNA helicase RecQ
VNALRSWRLERARSDGVPAYVVMSDRTLVAIGQRQPRTSDALLEIPGIGPAKLERYGPEILRVVENARAS